MPKRGISTTARAARRRGRVTLCQLVIWASLLQPLVPGESVAQAAPEATARQQRSLPNVLFISLDTTRADFLTFKDAETSEHMTRLAKRGTIFSQAISVTSWTLPSHAQMMTGMAPPYHGTESSDVAIDPLFPFLPELMKQAGYYTAGFFTVRYLWGDYGFARGYDFYRSGMMAEELSREQGRLSPRGHEADERRRVIESRDYVSSENVVALARMGLERAPLDAPVFVFAHFFNPHNDWVPPAPWDTRFDPDYEGEIDGQGVLSSGKVFDPMTSPTRRVDDRGLRHLRALYRGEIAWTDQAIGQLLALFAEHGRLDDTLIVITSDHGEEFFEHGQITHRFNLYDTTIRVPMLIVPPKSWSADVEAEIDAQVTLSDVMPTILDFTGLESPENVTGRSLRPAMEGAPIESRPELISLYLTKNRQNGRREHMQIYGLRTPEHKFLRAVILKPEEPMRVQAEFYDLVRDPAEQRGTIDTSDPRIRKGWADLEAELDRARAAWQTDPRTARANRSTDLSEQSIQELRALGYVDESTLDDVESRRPWGLAPMAPIAFDGPPSWRRYGLIPVLVALAGLIYWRRGRRASAG
jgi:arylsulfatase A-like enzyme